MRIPRFSSLPQSLRTYRELIHDGVIMSSADNDKVIVTLKGYVTGDIQLCIGPQPGTENPDWLTEGAADEAGKEALRLFRIKFESLRVLPLFLIFILNIGGIYGYYQLSGYYLKSFLPADISGIFNPGNLPYVIIPLVSIYFRRHIGGFILKIGIEFMFRFHSLKNLIKGRKKPE
ncbi:MAG: hypothetical protein AB9834_06300 [Lentimicrobium sp.]